METAYLLVRMHKVNGIEVPTGVGIYSEPYPTVMGPYRYRKITSRTGRTFDQARRRVLQRLDELKRAKAI